MRCDEAPLDLAEPPRDLATAARARAGEPDHRHRDRRDH
jgi:hypothetical protein